jgi:hypothetical protein
MIGSCSYGCELKDRWIGGIVGGILLIVIAFVGQEWGRSTFETLIFTWSILTLGMFLIGIVALGAGIVGLILSLSSPKR